jgi:hypothetical protein
MRQHDRELEVLHADLLRVQESFDRRIRMEARSASRRANDVEQHVGEVQKDVETLDKALKEVRELAEAAQKKAASTEAQLRAEVSALRTGAVVPAPASPTVLPNASTPMPTSPTSAVFIPSGWNSAIVPDFPELFEDFKGKRFTLLWRGSRDGFGVRDFHSHCDGHANTLTVILDTNGNIFGGFTPVRWSSPNPREAEADPSLKSFLFTLKNPHNVPARRFVLSAERDHYAIQRWSRCGPTFFDIGVSDKCNTSTDSYAGYFGQYYTNDTGLEDMTFFTGSQQFQVKEIEVFEITD